MLHMYTHEHDILIEVTPRLNEFRVHADGKVLGTVYRTDDGPMFMTAEGPATRTDWWACSRLPHQRFQSRDLAVEALFRKVHEYEPLTWALQMEADIADARRRTA